VPAAKYCVECGAHLETGEGMAGARGTVPAGAPIAQPWQALAPFAAIFGAIMAVGILVAYGIMRQLPQREALLASQPATPQQTSLQEARQLPPGHPAIQLPVQAREYIVRLEQKAASNPNDPAAWDKYGDASLRAAAFDPSYYPRASSAYAHALKLDPENLEALRGIGNIDFDERKYDEAIAAYEHYLDKKPDDPDVRTDLGTMLLSSGSADQAVVEYRKVLERRPNFFEASFNLGIAYEEMHQLDSARAAFEKAQTLAPDTEARNRVRQMLGQLDGTGAGASGNPQPAQVASVAGPAATNEFKGALERMLRELPIAGPKVASVQWTSKSRVQVFMDNFPMSEMPPFAAAKFLADLKAAIGEVKSAHDVTTPVEIDLCDAASGRVMKSVSE